MTESFWQLKTAALLATPPWGAFVDSASVIRAGAEELCAILGAGQFLSTPILDELEEVAWGIDRPAEVAALNTAPAVKDPLLVHPLSGTVWRGPKGAGFDTVSARRAELQRGSVNVVRAIADNVQKAADPNEAARKRFLAIWHALPAVATGNGLFPPGRLLPADARAPNRTWVDHRALVSCLASCGSDGQFRPAFLMFTIAATQEFVSTARRTQDAWIGSYLFTLLIWEAMRPIVERFGPDAILSPALRGQPLVLQWLGEKVAAEDLRLSTLTNRFTAIVPEAEADVLADAASQAVRKSWKEIGESVKGAIAPVTGAGLSPQALEYWRTMWERQLGQALDPLVYWSTLPWTPDGGVNAAIRQLQQELGRSALPAAHLSRPHVGSLYLELSQLTARRLDARKLLRDFRFAAEPGYKCSLCGVREALHAAGPDGPKTEAELREFWGRLAQLNTRTQRPGKGLKLQGRIRRGDRLCAVCLTKRLAHEFNLVRRFAAEAQEDVADHHIFPSTSTVAVARFQEAVVRAVDVQYDRDHPGVNVLPYREQIAALAVSSQASAEIRRVLGDYVRRVSKFLTDHGILLWSTPVPRLRRLIQQLASRTNDPELVATLDRFVRIDGDWLFEESYDADSINRDFLIAQDMSISRDDPLLKEAREASRALVQSVKKHTEVSPSRYLAILQFDGDSIGKWLGGLHERMPAWLERLHPAVREEAARALRPEFSKMLAAPPGPIGPSGHLVLNGGMAAFSLSVIPRVVEQDHAGKLVYSGGDDVLAFIAVEDALDAARRLRAEFGSDILESSAMAQMLPGTTLTASAAIVIIHHSHPLSHAMEYIRRVIKEEAKKVPGKDAVAIHVLKRSGDPLSLSVKWRLPIEPDGQVDALESIGSAAAQMKQGVFSSGLAHRLGELRLSLVRTGNRLVDVPNARTVAEMQRLVVRQVLSRGEAREDGDREAAARSVVRLLMGLQSWASELETTQPVDAWSLFVDGLGVARFLATEKDRVDVR